MRTMFLYESDELQITMYQLGINLVLEKEIKILSYHHSTDTILK